LHRHLLIAVHYFNTCQHQGRVQQLTGLISLSIGPAYIGLVSCWTAFIVIQ